MEEQNDKRETNILKLSASGFSDETWNRLNDSFLNIIENFSNKLENSTSIDKDTLDTTSSIVKDISTIATQWAKAKIEKPTLENEKIKAEIAEKFAQTKKVLKETEKTDEEIKSLRIENRHKELSYHLEELEKVFDLMQKFKQAKLLFSKDDGKASLFIGGKPEDYSQEEKQQEVKKNRNDEL